MKLPELYLPGCPHRPTPKQWLALSIFHAREILYGGAAGGGKSDYLIMAACQLIDVPGYSAVIFRRTFPQLAAAEDGLLARAQSWFHGQPGFDGSDTVNGFPTRWKYRGGGTLTFSHMQHEKDRFNHQGPSYQFIGWDELTQFTEGQYLYLLSRLRRTVDYPIPLRVRAASNPGGEGHDWVRSRFPVNARTDSDQRLFIPSKLRDNPHLDAEQYRATLMELHPYERAQLLNGDWDVRPPGARFRREWVKLVDRPPSRSKKQVRYWDIAATEAKKGRDPDWTVGEKMSRSHDGRYCVEDVVRFRGSPGTVDARILQTAKQDGRKVAIRIEQEPGSSGKIAAQHFTKLLAGFDVRSIPSTGDKITRGNPFCSQAEAGNVDVVNGPWLEEWFRELEMVGAGASHDDQWDATSGAFAELTRRGLSPSDAVAAMEAMA